MTVPAFHVEAKLHAFRKTQEGVVVAFTISPIDMPPQLALDPLGTRYMLALAAIGDDEQPIEAKQSMAELLATGKVPAPASPSLPPAERPGVETGSSPTARARASEMGKVAYHEQTLSHRARTRASILPKDERFRVWAASQIGLENVAIEWDRAAQFIRDHCCEGGSRKLIATDPEAYRKFLALERLFHEAIGVIPEMRS